MSSHPTDLIIHFVLFLVGVYVILGNPRQIAGGILFIAGIVLEYEQRSQTWYADLPTTVYWVNHALPDVVANAMGIVVGYLLFAWCNRRKKR